MSSEFKDNLKLARKLRGLSQGEVADGIGVARSTYALYESGKRDPGVEGLKKIAKVLDVTGDFLLGNEEIPLTQIEFLKLQSKYGAERLRAFIDALSKVNK